MTQRTLVLLKPDAVRRGLVGDILSRFEAKGLTSSPWSSATSTPRRPTSTTPSTSSGTSTRRCATSSPAGRSSPLVLEGDEAIEVVRAINGATDGRKAAPGTIRGDLSLSNRENLVHGSDCAESAAREIGLWFPDL